MVRRFLSPRPALCCMYIESSLIDVPVEIFFLHLSLFQPQHTETTEANSPLSAETDCGAQ